MNIKSFLVFASVIFLSACRATVSDGHYYGGHHNASYHDGPPAIRSFDIVDSYATNSAFEYGPYAISPYINGGEFEVFWEVDRNNYAPYRVELFLNDRRRPYDGITLSSAWCDVGGEVCSSDLSYQYCEYDSDFTIRCDLPESNYSYGRKDVSVLFDSVPEDLYLVLEVCDESLFYCEYQTLATDFE